MHSAFGTWLSKYNGRNWRIHRLKTAFNDARTNQRYLPSKFRNANAVYVLISTGDCVPDWGLELLQQCETCWKAGRYELSALEELRFLRRDLY